MIRKYKKGSEQFVQPNFQVSEFDCPCNYMSCNYTLVDDDLALGLQLLHDLLLSPIHITEGFRCEKYHADLQKRGYKTALYSQHLLGKAADLKTGKHTGEQLETAARKVGFRAVGVGKRWAHIDTRDIVTRNEKPRRWEYSY